MSALDAKTARNREYYSRNKTKILDRCREYYQEHREAICESVRQYELKRKTPFTSIYALREPQGLIRYIGKTVGRIHSRINEHFRKARSGSDNTYRSKWLRSIFDKGVEPEVIILEECSGDGCSQEQYHIWLADQDNLPLVNLTKGGDGAVGYCPTPESRARMSAVQKGKKLSKETKLKMSLSRKGKKHGPMSAEHKAKMLETMKRISPEVKAASIEKMRQSQIRRLANPELRERLSKATSAYRTGKKHSEEQKRNISMAHKTSLKAIAARQAVSHIRVEQMRTAIQRKMELRKAKQLQLF